jgi:hypothetical protein
MSFGQLTSEDIERREKKKEDARLAQQWRSVCSAKSSWTPSADYELGCH